ncbi:MAG TPA: DUF2220 family protein [Pseudomonadota bacterium]|nr:DUF2220 family protein [Pseudomonadota bacterium]
MQRPNPYMRPAALSHMQELLGGFPRRRIRFDELAALAAQISPWRHDPEARRFLAELCHHLSSTGVVEAVAAAGMDRSETPLIPARFHILCRASAAAPAVSQKSLHPALPEPPRSWRGSRELDCLNQWISAYLARAPEPAALRRRMLEIFGIDKPRPGLAPHLQHFPQWLGERQGLLNLWHYEHPGGSWHGSANGRVVIMIENAETFCVLARLLDAQPVPAVRELLFGSGNALARPLSDDYDRLIYFGDWDLAGLAALLRLRAADPRVRPWLAAYRRLLTFPAVHGYRPRPQSLAEEGLNSLFPPELAALAKELRAAPRLIPQEWLGFAELKALLPSLSSI